MSILSLVTIGSLLVAGILYIITMHNIEQAHTRRRALRDAKDAETLARAGAIEAEFIADIKRTMKRANDFFEKELQ